ITDYQAIKKGIRLHDGYVRVDEISYVSHVDRRVIRIVLHSGRYRVVRRLFEQLGYHIVSLARVMYAGLKLYDLAPGKWRRLRVSEIKMLHNL
ncbi:MAG: hypothetical protein WBQ73_00420, partial [Candidatus Babeliales bacterium]